MERKTNKEFVILLKESFQIPGAGHFYRGNLVRDYRLSMFGVKN